MNFKTKNLLLIFYIITSTFFIKTNAQNLVLNPSFEISDTCPNTISDLKICNNWSTPNLSTTDYFNKCSNNFSSSVPVNAIGKQWPHSGNAYIGLITYQKKMAYLEFAQGKLKEPLKRNKYYKVSFYVSASEISKYFHHSIGAAFSKDSCNWNHYYLNRLDKRFKIQEMNTVTINNTDKWILVKGLYKSRGGEKFIIIGNIYGIPWKSNIEKNKVNKPKIKEKISYCFIDDVSVTRAKSKRDTSFEKVTKISTNEFQSGGNLDVAKTDNIFISNSSKFLNIIDIYKKAQNDSGFVPEITLINYFGNLLIQNKTIKSNIVVYSQNNKQLAQKRAQSIFKYLVKKGVNKRQINYIGKAIKEEDTNKTERIEVEIIE